MQKILNRKESFFAMSETMKTISLQIEREQDEKLNELARQNGMTKSAFLRVLISQTLNTRKEVKVNVE